MGRRSDRRLVASVLTRPDEAEQLELAKAGRPFGLVPAGDCPYCHAGLERRVVRLPNPFRDYEIFTFWQCTNDRCCLMFWRRPRAMDRPLGDDAIEH